MTDRERSRSPEPADGDAAPAPAPADSNPPPNGGGNGESAPAENGGAGGDAGEDGVKLYVGNLEYCKFFCCCIVCISVNLVSSFSLPCNLLQPPTKRVFARSSENSEPSQRYFSPWIATRSAHVALAL